MKKLILAIAIFLGASPLWAELMTYQGRLKESGIPVTGNRLLTFEFCDQEDGSGVCLMAPGTPASFAVANGLFKSTITIHPNVDLAAGAWYLRVTVGSSVLAPLERLTAVPYSVFASSAGYASYAAYAAGAVLQAGDTMTGPLTLAGSTLTVTGNAFSVGGSTFVVKDGSVGIGTASPNNPLEVWTNGQYVFTGGAPTSDAVVNLIPQVGGTAMINNNADGSVALAVGHVSHLLVDKTGNVGVGSAVPSYRLSVSSGAGETGTIMAVSTGTSNLFWVTGDGAHALRFVGDGSGLTGVTGATGTDPNALQRAGGTMLGPIDMNGNFLAGVSTITMLNGSIAIVPPGTGGSNGLYGVSIGSDSYDNSYSGVGVGHGSYMNSFYGVGVGASAHTNSTYGVGVGAFANNNSNNGVGIGADASGNSNYGTGIGFGAASNADHAVGVGAYSHHNRSYGSALGAYSQAAASATALGSYAKANAYASVAIGAGTVNNSTGTASFGNFAVYTSTAVNAAYYQVNGSTVLALLNGSLAAGPGAGRQNTGLENVFVGSQAGENTQAGDYNVFLGYQAGMSNTLGYENAFLGTRAGRSNTTGTTNTLGGTLSGSLNQTGSANTAFGYSAGYGVASNSFSSATLVGYKAGTGLSTGSDNIFVGFQAGDSVTTGGRNIVIGYDEDASAPGAVSELNIGGVIFGSLNQRTIGISTRAPQAALDIVSTGTAHTEMAQIWRDSTGLIVGSMSVTGSMQAVRFVGDGSGLSGVTGATGTDPDALPLAGGTMSGTLSMGGNTIADIGSLGLTGARVAEGFFTDLAVSNAIAGSVAGNAGSVTNGVYTNADNTLTSAAAPLLIKPAGAPPANTKLMDMQATGGGVTNFSVDSEGDVVAASFTGPLTGNVTGNVTGAASMNVLKAGDTMTGDLFMSGGSSISVTGAIGISTAAPGAQLAIEYEWGTVTPIMTVWEPSAGYTFGLDKNAHLYYGPGLNYGAGSIVNFGGDRTQVGSGAVMFHLYPQSVASGGYLLKAQDGADMRLAVDSEGRVGVGTALPASLFHVAGGSVTISGAAAGLLFDDEARKIALTTSSAVGAGLFVSTNVYIVGFSSAAKYYGDGSGLTNVTAPGAVHKAGDVMDGPLYIDGTGGSDVSLRITRDSTGELITAGLSAGATMVLYADGSSVGLFSKESSDRVDIGAGMTAVMRVTQNSVGINTVTPEAALQVSGGAKFLSSAGTSYILTAGSAARPDMFFVSSGGIVGAGDFTGISVDTYSVVSLAPVLKSGADGAVGLTVYARTDNAATVTATGPDQVLAGGNFEAAAGGDDSLTLMAALRTQLRREAAGAGGGTVSKAYGIIVDDIYTDSGAGVITDTYGIYIGNQSSGFGGMQTNLPYAIYSQDPGARTFLAGSLGVGRADPAASLDLAAQSSDPATMGQIWRNAIGTIVSSMSATGVMMAARFVGDGSGLTNITTAGAVQKAGDTMQGALNMDGNFLAGVSTITMLNGSIAIVPPGTPGSNASYGISIGSFTYNNYTSGVGVGHTAATNYNYGVGVGYGASSNYSSGVGVGNASSNNYTSGVGVGNSTFQNRNYGVGVGYNASNNYNYGVGLGANAQNNNNYAVGVGAYSQNNAGYGAALGAYSYASSSATALGAQAKANAELSLALGYGTVNNSTGTASFGAYAVHTSTAVNAAYYQLNGSTVLAMTTSRSMGLGIGAGRLNTGQNTLFVGDQAGYDNTDGHRATFVGVDAGRFNSRGYNNSYLGMGAGYAGTTGTDNTSAGAYAMWYNVTGAQNVAVGVEAGKGTAPGQSTISSSTLVGYRAGTALLNGSYGNVLLGFQAGDSIGTGSRNIIIGYDADAPAAASSDHLNIGGVLYGDLAAKTIGISTRAPQAALDVVSTGTAVNVYAQIWRNSGGTIVSSVSATGVLMAAKFVGDGSGLSNISALDPSKVSRSGDTMTGPLTIAGSSLTIRPAASDAYSLYVSSADGSAPALTVRPGGQLYTAGRVGIGSAAPTEALDISGRVLISTRVTGDVNLDGLISFGTQGMAFQSGGGTYMRVANGGNYIGIGPSANVQANTNSPRLQVKGSMSVGSSYGTSQPPVNSLVVEGRLGAGTSTPDAALSVVQSDVAGSSYTVHIGTSASAYHLVVTTGGWVGLNTHTPQAPLHLTAATKDEGIVVEHNSNTSEGSYLALLKARGTSNSQVLVQNGDNLGVLAFGGYNGAAGDPFPTAAAIVGRVDGTPSVSPAQDMPGRLEFMTAADNTTNMVTRMVITNNGGVGISTGNPQAMLDIRSTSTIAQIWRDSGGVARATMTASGVLYAEVGSAVQKIGDIMTGNLVISVDKAVYGVDFNTGGISISTAGSITTIGLGNGSVNPSARGRGAVDLQTYRLIDTEVASGGYATLSGGYRNTASSWYGTVSGGIENKANGTQYGTVSGGYQNTASGDRATVSGGASNTASDYAAAVSGGIDNTASGSRSTVSGGQSNRATAQYAAVSGGYQNTSGGYAATVSGGRSNTALGNYSWAGGYFSSSTANGSFTWSDSGGFEIRNTAADRTLFKNAGGFMVAGSTVANSSTLPPSQGMLDIISTGTTVNQYAQVWRDAGGVVKASMTANGTLYANVYGLADKVSRAGDFMYGPLSIEVADPEMDAFDLTTTGLSISTSGALQTQGFGDGTATPGPRGMGAVDLQTARTEGIQVAGGIFSVIGGGAGNMASGNYAAVPGGYQNTAKGNYSFAAGYMSSSTVNGTFTWSDSAGVEVLNAVADQVMFKAAGGFWVSTGTVYTDPALYVSNTNKVGIGTNTPGFKLHVKDLTGGAIAGLTSSASSTDAGVYGWSNSAATAVKGVASSGYAGRFEGKVLVTDSGTNPVNPAKLQVKGDLGLGDGSQTGNTPLVIWLTASTAFADGDVVIASGNNQFGTTTTANSSSVIGVAQGSGALSAVGKIAVAGVVVANCVGGTVGQHAVTSATAGSVSGTGFPSSGTGVGLFLTDCGNPNVNQARLLLK